MSYIAHVDLKDFPSELCLSTALFQCGIQR